MIVQHYKIINCYNPVVKMIDRVILKLDSLIQSGYFNILSTSSIIAGQRGFTENCNFNFCARAIIFSLTVCLSKGINPGTKCNIIIELKSKWFCTVENSRIILKTCKEDNDKTVKLVEINYADRTLNRFKTTYEHTAKFIKWKYNVGDMDINKLKYELLSEL
ncbi:MAG: hypothetical protein ABIN89_03485 [Chitinophagaceae bacterium]